MTAIQYNGVGHHKSHDNKHEVIGHLDVVAGNLEHCKQRRQRAAREITPPVTQHYTRDCGRYIGERYEFPYMTRTDYDEEIGRESIGYGTRQGKIPLNLHGQKQDEKSHHHGEYKIGRRR